MTLAVSPEVPIARDRCRQFGGVGDGDGDLGAEGCRDAVDLALRTTGLQWERPIVASCWDQLNGRCFG